MGDLTTNVNVVPLELQHGTSSTSIMDCTKCNHSRAGDEEMTGCVVLGFERCRYMQAQSLRHIGNVIGTTTARGQYMHESYLCQNAKR